MVIGKPIVVQHSRHTSAAPGSAEQTAQVELELSKVGDASFEVWSIPQLSAVMSRMVLGERDTFWALLNECHYVCSSTESEQQFSAPSVFFKVRRGRTSSSQVATIGTVQVAGTHWLSSYRRSGRSENLVGEKGRTVFTNDDRVGDEHVQ